MRRTIVLVGLILIVFVATVGVVKIADGSCLCWQTKDCDQWQYDPPCATYEQTDMTDLRWVAATGYEHLSSGTIDRRKCIRNVGDDIIDSGDYDCDRNTTEHICHGGGTSEVQYPGGTVTWYAGYGDCP